MQEDYALLRLLADGRFHSGEEIATLSGVTRAAVWKKIQSLKVGLQLDIQAVTGRGYRLPGGLDMLDAQVIQNRLDKSDVVACQLEIFHAIDSTNQYLVDRRDQLRDTIFCCLAERQTAGRGRRGRGWVSPYGKNIYLSLAHWLNKPMYGLSGLSLVIGVAVAEALEKLQVNGLSLKWPNDLHLHGKKLGGILVELQGEVEGPVRVISGVGLNVELPAAERKSIEQPVTDLVSHFEHRPSRNILAFELIRHISLALKKFEQSGLAPFIPLWNHFDAYINQSVDLVMGDQTITGIYRGIDHDGELLLETGAGLQRYNAGEVSLRKKLESSLSS